jgi:phage terminase large subunit-like protein
MNPPTWSTACKDWEVRIVKGQSLIPDLPIFEAKADKALRIFKRLRVYDIPRQPTLGDCSPQWVFDFVYAIFGSFDPVQKRQLIRTFFLLIAKKNGKSTIAAGIMVTVLIMNEIEGGEYSILAPTKTIADNSFIPAMWMIKLDERLSREFVANSNYRTIINKVTGAKLKVVAADADTVGGIKSICTLVDELWLFGKKASFENVLSEAQGALATRKEGFLIFLSTQSDDPPEGRFKTTLEHGRRVRDGDIEDRTFLPVIYEYTNAILKKEEYWKDESVWHIPNPSLGYGVDQQWLREKLNTAELEGQASRNLFLAKHFNVEIGGRLRLDGWVGAEFWQQCKGVKDLDDLLVRSEVVTMGIDGGGLDDLLGFAVMGREKGTGKWLVWARAWAHEIALERRKSEAQKIRDLVQEGTVVIYPQIGDDLEDISQIVKKVSLSGLLPKTGAIGVDRVGIKDLGIRLMQPDIGITYEQIESVAQGWLLAGTIKTMERKLASNEIEHEGSALMAMSVGNARTELRGNAITITKAVSGTAKIDPLMATLDAAYLMGLNPVASSIRSVYEDRGFLVL